MGPEARRFVCWCLLFLTTLVFLGLVKAVLGRIPALSERVFFYNLPAVRFVEAAVMVIVTTAIFRFGERIARSVQGWLDKEG